MTECQRVADQLLAAWHGHDANGEAWHGPALRTLLAPIAPEQAASRPIRGVHSIWELALHIGFWCRIPRARLFSSVVIDPTVAEGWPAPDLAGARPWPSAVASLERDLLDLAGVIRSLLPARLEDPVPGKPYSVYVMLHGVVQHTLYHAGQIAVLHRAQLSAIE